jgi:alpha-tubulin suppressor-like RCC1 family protein
MHATLRTTLILQMLIPAHLLFAAGHSCAVVGWGDNVAGQATGIPSFQSSNGVVVPSTNPFASGVVTLASGPLADAVAVAAGNFHSLALRADGRVVGWGDNQVGRVTGSETPFPHRTNGPVVIGGRMLTDVVSVAAGGAFGLALKRVGTLATWGKNTVPAGLSNVTAIAAGGFFSVALKNDGTVASWCSTPPGQAHVPPDLGNVVAIATGSGGYENSVALRRDGRVVVWGPESDSALCAGLSNAVAIAAGQSFALALKNDGTVFGWGYNGDGRATGVPTPRPPNEPAGTNGLVTIGGQVLSNVVAIAAGSRYGLALKRDGTVVAWGDKRFYRDVPAGLTNVVAIAAGEDFCLAITTNVSALNLER